jgi:hypothetical protein
MAITSAFSLREKVAEGQMRAWWAVPTMREKER